MASESKPVAFTVRLDKGTHEQLKLVSKLVNRSMNHVATDAIAQQLASLTREVERDLTSTLQRLRAYTARDPGFEQDIEEWADAEVSGGQPLEGALERGSSGAQALQAILDDRVG